MKDYDQEFLESSRPSFGALHCVEYCLKRLYEDRRRKIGDPVVKDLYFEELIGALLLARDVIRGAEDAD